MNIKKVETDYWFTIEPYVFVSLAKKCTLLYNTLDGVTFESDKEEVIELLRELLREENCGVVLLTHERYKQKNVADFIRKLRKKFMGDVIDVILSKGKPVQMVPYFNFPNKVEIYKKHNFSAVNKVLDNLSEISIHLDSDSNLTGLINFLQSISVNLTFNIVGDIGASLNNSELLSFFYQHTAQKKIICSYKNIFSLQTGFDNDLSYRISVDFPIDTQLWNQSRTILLGQTLPIEYVFNISSEEEYQQAEQLVVQFGIEKYRLNPVYTGDNIRFFEDDVFLTKKDILSIPMTIKDFFSRQAMNLYDFGKINILPNGDVYANLNFPALGNINTDSIYEIVNKEVEEGKSWFRIRNQAPCNDCVYQWLCPPPSDYEIQIGRPNLCHVKK